MIKKIFISIIVLFCANITLNATQNLSGSLISPSRNKISFDNEWYFSLGNVDDNYNPTEWRLVNLPHDWSREYGFSEKNNPSNGSVIGGMGYYKKEFFLDNSFEGKNIEINFDGVYKEAEVIVNGESIGTQHDGYTSFFYNITSNLKVGSNNTILIKVDNTKEKHCRWYSGSGIYRHVWLTVTNPLRIATWGTSITTPSVSKERAQVIASTTIENSGDIANVVIKSTLKDNKGATIETVETTELIDRNSSFSFRHYFNVENPKLWSTESPNLYSVVSEVIKDNKVIDSYTTSCGIREIKFDAKKGFFLNGESLKMKGVCLHHDGGTFGAAVPEAVWEFRLIQLKRLGCNAIRTAHNPTAPEFLDLCDKYGFLVMNEFVDKWDLYHKENWNSAAYTNPFFRSEWKKNYTSTIKRDRNHPSVIIWSVGNETNLPGEEMCDRLLDEYCSLVRSIDPTRIVLSGMMRYSDPKEGEEEKKIDMLLSSASYMDVFGMNYCEQWLDRMSKRELDKPFLSTESYIYFNSTETKRHSFVEWAPWLDVIKHDFNMGLFLWAGIDHLGEARWPSIGSNRGLIDVNARYKEVSYFLKSLWNDEPMVYAATYKNDNKDFKGLSNWDAPYLQEAWQRDGKDTVDVVTYTNCEVVELYLNNKKIGEQKLANNPNKLLKWHNINYQDGTLKAIGKNGGEAVCEFNLTTPSKPSAIKVKELNKEIGLNSDYLFIDITLVDSKGVPCYYDKSSLEFSIKGGEIVSLSNGSEKSHKLFTDMQHCTTHKGRCVAIVLASKTAQKVELTVKGDKLKSGKLIIGQDIIKKK